MVRRESLAEAAIRAGLLLYLLWIPLPFGSVTPFAQVPLVLPPLVLLALISFFPLPLNLPGTPEWRRWNAAALVLIGVALIQLLPLGETLVGILSPAAAGIWHRAAAVTTLGGGAVPTARLTISPSATWMQLLRLASYLALFHLGRRLFIHRTKRLLLSASLAVSGVLQASFAVKQWSEASPYGTHKIWGWHDAEIFSRSSGTFVNPNHFAAYEALIAPLVLYLLASQWRWSAGTHGSLLDRIGKLLEKGLFRFALVVLALAILIAGILLSQSRSAVALLALALLVVAPALPARNNKENRFVRASKLGGAVVTLLLVLFLVGGHLGHDATKRLTGESRSLMGRTTGLRAAFEVRKRFPLTGSGLGTFDRAVWATRTFEGGKAFNHVHNDVLELLATTGIFGLAVIALVIGGFIALVRSAWAAPQQTSDRRMRRFLEDDTLFIAATAASIAVIGLHQLIDFDFFIPAIPATLALIAGSGSGASALRASINATKIEEPAAAADHLP
jgi:O-antigen ligase